MVETWVLERVVAGGNKKQGVQSCEEAGKFTIVMFFTTQDEIMSHQWCHAPSTTCG